MSDKTPKYRKLFTVDQANAMLPLVRAIATDLSRLYTDLVDRQQRLAHLTSGRERSAGDVYGDELAQIERELEKDKRQLREYVSELQSLGVECKDPAQGLIDFPTDMDGRVVFLCWRLGEPELLYWHEIEAGFAGRQSLTADTAADNASDSSMDIS